MLLTIYIALITVLLLACSVWAMWKKDSSAQAVFAGAGEVLAFLLFLCLVGGIGDVAKVAGRIMAGALGFAFILLICHSTIGALKDKRQL